MTVTEARLRGLFQEMAEEAQPAAMLGRLDDRAPVARQRRRLVMAGVAAAALVAVAVSTAFVQSRLSAMPQPADRPPPVFELGNSESARPGTAWMAVTIGAQNEATVFVTPAGGGAVVSVPPSDGTAAGYLAQRLSPDGSHLVSVVDFFGIPSRVDVQDLRTGQVVELDEWGYFAELAPDNRTVAVYLDGEVRLVDVATGAGTTVHWVPPYAAYDPIAPGLGWAPDGSRLAAHVADDLAIVDTQGTEQHLFTGVHLTNGSQSWSPDGRSLLVYDSNERSFAVQPVDDGDLVVLTAPSGGLRPLGWAGDRVVWLTGDPGSQQRLVAADVDGSDAETWVRFEVGTAPVESVTWSRALSG